jgi:lipoate-protein ligase A
LESFFNHIVSVVMKFLVDNRAHTHPAYNLALEEYLLRHADPTHEYVLLYRNASSVVVGKHQNILEEVNWPYVREAGVKVVRRISGGGTVYHDTNNMNFSFITRYDSHKVGNYPLFNAPVIAALNSLGVPAMANHRNDIIAEGKKISGNAQFSSTKMMMSHGTLLIEADLERLRQAIQPPIDKISSNGVKSYRSQVENIRHWLGQDLSLQTIEEALICHIFEVFTAEAAPRYQLDEAAWQAIEALVQEKYLGWAWTLGRNPACTIERSRPLGLGILTATIHIREGRIQELALEAPHITPEVLQAVSQSLLQSPYEYTQIQQQLRHLNNTQASVDQWAAAICDFVWPI